MIAFVVEINNVGTDGPTLALVNLHGVYDDEWRDELLEPCCGAHVMDACGVTGMSMPRDPASGDGERDSTRAKYAG